jgi:hypothetical protein
MRLRGQRKQQAEHRGKHGKNLRHETSLPKLAGAGAPERPAFPDAKASLILKAAALEPIRAIRGEIQNGSTKKESRRRCGRIDFRRSAANGAPLRDAGRGKRRHRLQQRRQSGQRELRAAMRHVMAGAIAARAARS